MSRLDDYLLHLEKELMVGKGVWVADFKESFRNVEINGIQFDMVVRGNTRTKGLFLSRLFAFLTMPNYQVACLVFNGEQAKSLDNQFLDLFLKAAEGYIKKNELAWAWFVIAQAGDFPEAIKIAVGNLSIKEIGVALIDIDSGAVTSSKNYLGMAMPRYIK